MLSKPHNVAFEPVWEFERQMAAFAGAKHGIATDSCTSALFLCCKHLRVQTVFIPDRTYISVPSAIIHANGSLAFTDLRWTGTYALKPYPIIDGALRMKRGMYQGGYHCLSFQARKHLAIGRGGMILTDSDESAAWFRRARANGRDWSVPYAQDKIDMLGWNMAMTPEQASRGLMLMEMLNPDAPDIVIDYPSLLEMPVFNEYLLMAA